MLQEHSHFTDDVSEVDLEVLSNVPAILSSQVAVLGVCSGLTDSVCGS